MFRYIDGWHNPRRIQEGLDGLWPNEYEDDINVLLYGPAAIERQPMSVPTDQAVRGTEPRKPDAG